MVLATIIYNASSGSDTGASGSNAPTSALTDVTESETISTATSTTQTFSSAVDLTQGTGVNDDGTDVIWIDSPTTERHLFRITSFTGGAAACTAIVTAEAAIGTDSTLAWAVGGLRQTLDADTGNPDLDDGLAGWEFELQAGTYTIAQTNTISSNTTAADGSVSLVAASGASPTIAWTGDFAAITMGSDAVFYVRGIAFLGTSSTSASQQGIEVTTFFVRLVVIDCTFDQYGFAIQGGGAGYYRIGGCDMTCNTGVILELSNGPLAIVENCVIHDGPSNGIDINGNADRFHVSVVGCIIRDNGNDGISMDGSHRGVYTVKNCVIHEQAGQGMEVTGSPRADANTVFVLNNNIISENGQYGINFVNAWHEQAFIDYNAYYSNTSGEVNNVASGSNDVTLTADPYTDEAGDDYSLNATAGGGADCTDAGFGRTT